MSKQRSLPKLTLLGRKIDVRLYESQAMGDTWGDVLPHDQKIRIRDDLLPLAEGHVMIHEIIHVYDQVLGINLKHASLDALAYSLMDLLVNNPQFVRYIQKLAAGEAPK